jgi:hypothetical protein
MERALVTNCADASGYDISVGRAVSSLWNGDEGVRAAYSARTRFVISDSAPFFFDKALATAAPTYQPSVEDVLRVRQRTTSVIEEEIWVDHALFHLVDVGGQKNERKKWINCFEGCTAVIFLASLADYDLVSEDDPTLNRLMESLELFAEIVNSPWFEDSCVILLLNKRDVFAQKLASGIDLQHDGDLRNPPRFQDYKGGRDPIEAADYIKGRFLELAKREERPVHCHITCATDSKNVRLVIKACKDEIMKENLIKGGMGDQ